MASHSFLLCLTVLLALGLSNVNASRDCTSAIFAGDVGSGLDAYNVGGAGYLTASCHTGEFSGGETLETCEPRCEADDSCTAFQVGEGICWTFDALSDCTAWEANGSYQVYALDCPEVDTVLVDAWLHLSASTDSWNDGDSVSTWYDKSSNGHDVTVTSPNYDITFKAAGGLTGRPAMLFDDKHLLCSATALPVIQEVTVFFKGAFSTAVPRYAHIVGQGHDEYWAVRKASHSIYGYSSHITAHAKNSDAPNTALPLGQPMISVATFQDHEQFAGTRTMTVYDEYGSQLATDNTTDSNAIPPGTEQLCVGLTKKYVGTTFCNFQGEIEDIVVYDRLLDASEIAAVVAALATAQTTSPTPSPTTSPTEAPTPSPSTSPTNAPTAATCDTHTCTDGTLKSSPESFTGADDATCCDVCDLRVDSDDIEKTWMSEYTISDGVVTVKVQEELEWIIENEKPTLTGQMVACISGFAWGYAVEGCDYREWTGTIGINVLLQCSSGVAEDVSVVDGPDISRMRVEFEMSSLRNVEYYMAGVGDPTSIITTRNTLMPMLFDFQKTINVESQNIAVTSMYFPVTEVVATLTGSDDGEPLTDDEKDEITNSIAAHFNFPSAAIKFTFAESGSIVVTAQVPSDVSTTCAALTFTSFSAVVECAVGEDFASIREVTERSVISVGWTEGSISGLTAEANLKVYTNMQVPYELVNPQHKNQNSALTYSAFETTGTCSLNVDCEKYFKWTLTDDHASPVCTFSGSYEVEFDVVCSQEYNGYVCPLIGNETITTTVSLESGYHCPDTENAVDIALLATELFSNRVDSDDSETVTDSFLNTQTLKFHADVRADNAGLKDAKFIAISIADVNGGVDLELYNGGLTDSGTLLALAVTDIIDSTTDPESDSSVLSPSFTLIADADTLGLDLQETAVFQVTATIAAVYEADGVRRRALLQVSYDASTETSRTVIISAEDAAMQVLEESAAHNSVSAGLWLALLSVYTAFALHF